MLEQTTVVRRPGDKVQFHVVPWLDNSSTPSPIYEGIITKVVDDTERGTCYHVDAMIGSKHVEDGLVLECELVEEWTKIRNI